MIIIIAISVISLLLLIILLKEYIQTIYEFRTIKKELEKYNAINNYEVRKLINLAGQSRNIFKNAGTKEEKLHWCEVIINTYKKMKEYTSIIVHPVIDEKLEKFDKTYKYLSHKIIEEKQRKKDRKISQTANKKIDTHSKDNNDIGVA